VELAIRAGLTLDGQVATHTKFDRKNYFYPDLPKGYQITQFDQPIIEGGVVELPSGKQIGLIRSHLEEDAGKLTHPEGVDYSLVDLNRAGTPLLEIVSQPELSSAEEAKAYAKELYLLMRYAEVSDADLYQGHMRFDVNISLRTPDGELGTRTEIKNLNSFRAVEGAVRFEINRQAAVLAAGGDVVQETRGWDEVKLETYSQRSKEESHDYRYFPEPDLPPLVLKTEHVNPAKQFITRTPLPIQLRQELKEQGLPASDIEALLESGRAGLAAEAGAAAKGSIKRICAWILSELQDPLTAAPSALALAELAQLVEDEVLSSSAAKKVLGELAGSDKSARQVASDLNLVQVSDNAQLAGWVEEALGANPGSVQDYRAGKTQALQFLVGKVMAASRGKANPGMVSQMIKAKLDQA
jgi:aspartyl-tRNA(Asn)/glutamyl-tRNA(Gln) amidotransferase subunit B